MVRITLFILFFMGILPIVYSQKIQPLTTLKSTNDTLDVRYNDYLNEQSWILSSRKRIDVLPVQIDDSPIKVTIISSIDSVSFNVKLGDKYDFIIVNGEKQYKTRIEGIQAYQTRKDDSLAHINLQCLKTDLLSVVERNKKYPFNKATRIELISFTDTGAVLSIPIPVKNGRLDQSKIVDQKILHTKQINKLTDILFNVGRTPIPNLKYAEYIGSGCYEPRNGIVFVDSNERVFAYIEICFECQQHRFSSRRIKPWDDCEQKHDMLRHFFADQGIKFGTAERRTYEVPE